MSQERITVQTSVKAGIDKVWNSWTAPEHITQWNAASDDWHCPAATNDLRTGGKFTSTMASRDGKMSFEFGGIYDEVVPGKKISYTMEDGRKVDVLFEDRGHGTLVVETFDPENVHPHEMQQAGWQSILDRFRKYTEGL